MKYRFMIEHATLMCRVPRVAHAEFYEWLRESVCDRAKEDERLLNLIRDSCAVSRGGSGARRVFGDLWDAEETAACAPCRNASCAAHDKAVRGYKAARAIAARPSIVAPNHLQLEFTVDAPNTVG